MKLMVIWNYNSMKDIELMTVITYVTPIISYLCGFNFFKRLAHGLEFTFKCIMYVPR
jgi:hypothetical protein